MLYLKPRPYIIFVYLFMLVQQNRSLIGPTPERKVIQVHLSNGRELIINVVVSGIYYIYVISPIFIRSTHVYV